MRNLMKFYVVAIIVICLSLSLSNCNYEKKSNNTNSNNPGILYFNGKSAKVEYSADKWKLIGIGGDLQIQRKNTLKLVLLSAGWIPSTLKQEEYIANFKKFMLSRSKDGKVEEGKLGNYPLLTYTENKGALDFIFSVAIIKDGDAYYELTFSCYSKLYPKYIGDALDVMKTFQVIQPSVASDITDKDLKLLDQLAGIDKDAVRKNISDDGKELVGEWGQKDKDGNINVVLILNSDGSYKRYKTFGDENNIISGTWEYANRILILHNKKAVTNGVDSMNGIRPEIQHEVLNFKENTIFLRNLYSLNEITYFKK